MMDFYVYILKCSDNFYYVGHTDNLEHRIGEHISKSNNSYVSKRLPATVAFVQNFASRAEALEQERKLKGWSRKKKEALIQENWDLIKELSKKKFD